MNDEGSLSRDAGRNRGANAEAPAAQLTARRLSPSRGDGRLWARLARAARAAPTDGIVLTHPGDVERNRALSDRRPRARRGAPGTPGAGDRVRGVPGGALAASPGRRLPDQSRTCS